MSLHITGEIQNILSEPESHPGRTRFFPGCDRPFFRVQLFLSSFWEKLDFWMSDSMSNLAIFWKILKIRRRKFLKKSHEIRTFFTLFYPIWGVNPAISPCGSRPCWRACSHGGIAVSWYKNNHFFERIHTKTSQMDTPKEPNNWTKSPVTGHKTMVCHTLGVLFFF